MIRERLFELVYYLTEYTDFEKEMEDKRFLAQMDAKIDIHKSDIFLSRYRDMENYD